MSEPRNHSLGPYQILDQIAQGAYGEVYRARHVGPAGFQRMLAIKRLRPHVLQDASAVRAFENEARIGGLLLHHNIAQTLEFRQDAGVYYLVMEYVDGVSFQDLVANHRALGQPVPPPIAVELIAQACEGLHYAHEAKGPDGAPLKLIHRDIKPSNLMLTRTGVVKVMDFGIARVDNQNLTDAGFIKGTPRYLSPEMISRNAPVDRRSDLFSLAAVLYELLELKPLFDAGTLLALMGRVRDADVGTQLKELSARSPSLMKLLGRVLTQSPDKRLQTAREFNRELRKLAKEFEDQEVDLEAYAHTQLQMLEKRTAESKAAALRAGATQRVTQTPLHAPPQPPASPWASDKGSISGPNAVTRPVPPRQPSGAHPSVQQPVESSIPNNTQDLLAGLDARSAMLESQELSHARLGRSAMPQAPVSGPQSQVLSLISPPPSPPQTEWPAQTPSVMPTRLPSKSEKPWGDGPELPPTAQLDLRKAPREVAAELRSTVVAPGRPRAAQGPMPPPPVMASSPAVSITRPPVVAPPQTPTPVDDEEEDEESARTISGDESPVTDVPTLAAAPAWGQTPSNPSVPTPPRTPTSAQGPAERTEPTATTSAQAPAISSIAPVEKPESPDPFSDTDMDLQVDEDPPSASHPIYGFSDDWEDEKSRVVNMEDLGLLRANAGDELSGDMLKSVADIPIPGAFTVGLGPQERVTHTGTSNFSLPFSSPSHPVAATGFPASTGPQAPKSTGNPDPRSAAVISPSTPRTGNIPAVAPNTRAELPPQKPLGAARPASSPSVSSPSVSSPSVSSPSVSNPQVPLPSAEITGQPLSMTQPIPPRPRSGPASARALADESTASSTIRLEMPPPGEPTQPTGFEQISTRMIDNNMREQTLGLPPPVLVQKPTGFEQMSTRMLDPNGMPMEGDEDGPAGATVSLPSQSFPLSARSTFGLNPAENQALRPGTRSTIVMPSAPKVETPVPPKPPVFGQAMRPGSIVFRGKRAPGETGPHPLVILGIGLIVVSLILLLLSKL